MWIPPNEIGPNERIGRRVFDEPLLKAAGDQPSWTGIQLFHFEEKRGSEVSLDRLGATGVDKKVRRYLLERANADAVKTREPRRFDGWFVVSAKAIAERQHKKISLVASPVVGEPPNDNCYHAHAVRPEDWDPEMMALKLRHLFTTYGEFAPSNVGDARSQAGDADTKRLSKGAGLFSLFWAILRLVPRRR